MVALDLHQVHSALVRGFHFRRQRRSVAGLFPVVPGQDHRIGERVEFEFLFGDPVIAVERVGVRVDEDVLGRTGDHAAQHGLDRRVLREEKIGTHLRAGVAQPHRADVAGDDIGGLVRREAHIVTDGGEQALRIDLRCVGRWAVVLLGRFGDGVEVGRMRDKRPGKHERHGNKKYRAELTVQGAA